MQAFSIELTQQYITLLKDVLTTLATVGLAIIAWQGLKTWRRQLKGQTEYELARRILQDVYAVREAVRALRKPHISDAETNAAVRSGQLDISDSDPDYRTKGMRAVYDIRRRRISRVMKEMDLDALEGEAIWESELREALLPLRQNIAKLQKDLDRYLMWKEDPNRYPLEDEEGSRIEEALYDIYYLTAKDSDNQFTAKIAASIALAEDFLRPRLKI